VQVRLANYKKMGVNESFDEDDFDMEIDSLGLDD